MTSRARVLAIRLDTIGDVIMTTPALGAMVDAGAEVTLLTSTYAAPLAPMLGYLDGVVTLDVPWMKPAERHLVPASAHLRVLDGLRARRFDAAVVFTVSTQNPACAAYLAYLCGVPRVVSHVGGKLYGLVTEPVEDSDAIVEPRHEVVRQLDLAAAAGFPTNRTALRLDIPPPARAVRSVLERVGGGPWCLIHPGATAPSRRYPEAQWAEVCDLLGEAGVPAVLAGGRQDRHRCAEIAALSRANPMRVDGRLTLPEFAALMKAAPVAVTCNSAASHIAAAAVTPVVTLYAGTNSQHAPWSPVATVLRHETPCAWCFSSVCPHGTPVCTASIGPETVARAALERLSAPLARRPVDVAAQKLGVG